MKALVTGGSGFLGRHIVAALLRRGWSVRVMGRHHYPDLERQGVECVEGDICSAEAVEAACRGMDVVFHTAGITGIWGRKEDFFEINSHGTEHVVFGCLWNGVRRLVYTSSPSVVFAGRDIHGGDESLPYPERYLAHYPASKAKAEKMVLGLNGKETGPPATENRERILTCAIRPHLLWGPGDRNLVPRVIWFAETRPLRRVGSGRNLVDLTYVENAAEAHILAAERLVPGNPVAGRAFFIGDQEPVVLWDWIDDLLGRLGLPPVKPGLPYPLAVGAGALLEMIHTLFPRLGEPALTRFLATQLGTSHYFDHSQAVRMLGYKPVVDRDTGMERLVAWVRESGLLSDDGTPASEDNGD